MGSLTSAVRERHLLPVSAAAVLLVIGGSAAAVAKEKPLPESGPDTTVQYVGVTSDPDIYVAVVDHGDHVTAYLCDGAELGLWLTGTKSDDAATLSAADGSTGSVTVAEAGATGTVTLADGTALTFDAPVAVLPAGLHARTTVVGG